MAQAAAKIATAEVLRSGARYSIKPSSRGTTIASSNCEPTAKASETASNTIRRQFHRTTSRGAYKVWETAMAVNTAPNIPQTAPMCGCEYQSEPVRITVGEKQYNPSAIKPPAFPKSLRDTYQREPPSITAK